MSTATPAGPVLAAVDDDGNAGAVLSRAVAVAAELGVSLRAAYVWSDCRPPECAHHRRCHQDLDEAARLLAELVDAHLNVDQAERVERDVVHHSDPAQALAAMSATASVVVIGSRSRRPPSGEPLGETARALLDANQCPVVVVPHQRSSATGTAW
jgi:nucleotide-binding universal stress UspA family protein